MIYPHRRDGQIGRGEIRFGLTAISGVGDAAVQAILQARRPARFRDLFDFCERVDLSVVNKPVIEALIKAGAFDATGAMRRALMEALERALDYGQQVQRDRRNGQLHMFGESAGAEAPRPRLGSQEWSDAEMLAYEKATLGFYITRHPLARYEELLRALSNVDTAGLAVLLERSAQEEGGELRRARGGAKVVLGGLIAKLRTVPIRRGPSQGQKMAVLTLEDFVGSVEALLFPEPLEQARPWLKPDAVVFVEGELDTRRESPGIRVHRVIPVEQARRVLARKLVVRLEGLAAPLETLPRLRQLCQAHRGHCRLYFSVALADGSRVVIHGHPGLSVEPTDEFLAEAEMVLGPGRLRCGGTERLVRTT